MPNRRRLWSVDDLFLLSQYPKKTLVQLAKELGCAISTVRRALLELGKEMHKPGRGPREVAAEKVL